MSACSEPGCYRPIVAKGLCSKHYARMRAEEQKQAMGGQPQGATRVTEGKGIRPGNGVSREMYLLAKDAADELGVSAETLTQMRKELGCGTEHKANVRTYTARDIANLRVLLGWMRELDCSAAMANKVMRKVGKLREAGAPLPGE